jgi:hypothetical protein
MKMNGGPVGLQLGSHDGRVDGKRMNTRQRVRDLEAHGAVFAGHDQPAEIFVYRVGGIRVTPERGGTGQVGMQQLLELFHDDLVGIDSGKRCGVGRGDGNEVA